MNSRSIAPTSARTAPDGLGPRQQPLERLDDLGVTGADLLVGEPRVRDRLEQSAVDLLGARHLLEEREQRLGGIVGALELAASRGGLVHPLDDDRRDQILLGGKVAEQRPAADAGALGDLADADIEAAGPEQFLGRVEQPPPIALRVGPTPSLLSGHLDHILD